MFEFSENGPLPLIHPLPPAVTRRCGGFTIIEIIAVLFILSLLAAAAFPSFSMGGSGRMKTEARRIASLLTYLDESAAASRKTYFFSVDFGEGVIEWEGPDGLKTEKLGSVTSVRLQSRGEIRDGKTIVFFGPSGLRENLDVLIGDGAFDVSFNCISGRVKIFEKQETR